MKTLLLIVFCITLAAVVGITYNRMQHIQSMLAQAKAAPDAHSALSIVRNAMNQYCPSCTIPEEIIKAEGEYFEKGVMAGDPQMLRELYSRPHTNANTLQAELKDRVLDQAKSSSNPDVLFAAALIYNDSTMRVRDTKMAIFYFKKAYASGDEESAGLLSRIYQRRNDNENAYLWSLRCIGACDRGMGTMVGERINAIDLAELEKTLSLPAIERIQQAAKQKYET